MEANYKRTFLNISTYSLSLEIVYLFQKLGCEEILYFYILKKSKFP